MAERLAREKAVSVAERLGHSPGTLILAADTVVALGREILGKPGTADVARCMLRLLSGGTHRVITGVAVCSSGKVRSGRSTTHVTFKGLTRREIDWYVSTGDPFDKAGAYGIQGAAGLFVTGIRGSYSNVVGLPLDLTYRFLGLPTKGR